jgi:hypothetical protein
MTEEMRRLAKMPENFNVIQLSQVSSQAKTKSFQQQQQLPKFLSVTNNNEKEFVYKSDFDRNGIFYYLGTNMGNESTYIV